MGASRERRGRRTFGQSAFQGELSSVRWTNSFSKTELGKFDWEVNEQVVPFHWIRIKLLKL